MEVAFGAEDDRLALRNTLLLVRPLTGKLQAGLNSLCTGVHRKNHVEAEDLSNLLGILAEDGVVECARGQSKLLCLLNKCGNDSRVAVALKVGRMMISRERRAEDLEDT